MLLGYYVVDGHRYNVSGYDFGGNADFLLTPVTTNDKLYLDKGFIYSDGTRDNPSWESLWVGVSSGCVRCDCFIEEYGSE